MNKLLRLLGIIPVAAAVAVSFSACGEHVHKWGDWQRSETEHWRVCKTCKEEQREDHTDAKGNEATYVCDGCAEFKVLAFGFNGGINIDTAHADFAVDANKWFSKTGNELGFIYEYSNTGEKGWVDMNEENIANYDLIMLLNDKPASEESRRVFKDYVDNGGACMAFHAAGFAMWSTPETPPTEWDGWFSNEFLRCGVYGNCPRDKSDGGFDTYWNTWNPTSEPMTIETHEHFSTENLEFDEFISAPCEWYEWYNNLFEDEKTTVLISMNPTPENPAGDDNRPGNLHQVWRGGHHAIAWANSDYNMIYMNWGHNLQSYNDGEEGKQSSTFSSEEQNRFMIEAMFGLTKK